ncbi:MAG: hypothetical protein JNM69_39185 [Archangium sp.]|nr:hypothetical protein [Archangium sp.]
MSRPRARPRFSFEVSLPADEVSGKVKAAVAQGHEKVAGSIHPRTLALWIRKPHEHFWSPHLDAQLSELPGGRTRIDGFFAPHPQIWTAFVAVQLLFGLLSIAAGILLISQVTLNGRVLEASLLLAAMLVGGGLAYGAAYIGQGIGSEQMYELRSFLDHALD